MNDNNLALVGDRLSPYFISEQDRSKELLYLLMKSEGKCISEELTDLVKIFKKIRKIFNEETTVDLTKHVFNTANKLFGRIRDLKDNKSQYKSFHGAVAGLVYQTVLVFWNKSKKPIKELFEDSTAFLEAKIIDYPGIGFTFRNVLHIDQALFKERTRTAIHLLQFLKVHAKISEVSIQGCRPSFRSHQIIRVLEEDDFFMFLERCITPPKCICGEEAEEIILAPKLLLESKFLEEMFLKPSRMEQNENIIYLRQISSGMLKSICDQADSLPYIEVQGEQVLEFIEAAKLLGIDLLYYEKELINKYLYGIKFSVGKDSDYIDRILKINQRQGSEKLYALCERKLQSWLFKQRDLLKKRLGILIEKGVHFDWLDADRFGLTAGELEMVLDSQNKLTSLKINGEQGTREIMIKIGNLNDLEFLSLSRVALSDDEISQALNRLICLKHLHLIHCPNIASGVEKNFPQMPQLECRIVRETSTIS